MVGIGAICCDGLESCTGGDFRVRAGECQNDICCSGNGTCQASEFRAEIFPIRRFIGSLRCDGIDACKLAFAGELSGDLTCDGMASCEDAGVTFVGGTHAITCTGENACRCDTRTCVFSFAGVAWCQGNRAISVFQGDLWIWLWVTIPYPR